jgi:hypothetical protein
MDDRRLRYEEAWREFWAHPDETGREIVLARFMAYWRARNGSTTAMQPHFDKLDADCAKAIAEAEEAKGRGR